MSFPLILAYHRVLPETAGQTLVVSSQVFEKQISYLLKHHYKFYTLRELGEHNFRLPRRSVILTFDDGYQDNYLYLFPILKKFKLKVVIFVTTGYLGKTQPFFWDLKNKTSFGPEDHSLTAAQIKEMQSAGFEFGSHTVDHFELSKLSKMEIRQQLENSGQALKQITGQWPTSFCYPRGDKIFAEMISAAGYLLAVCSNSYSRKRFKLHRVGVYAHDTFGKFKLKLWRFQLWNYLRTFG
jgi:peptidoglycan/xylan/chitin deacetylase (PgdA/CDA1 family)